MGLVRKALHPRQSGYTLIIVLWLVTLLTFIAAVSYNGARTEIQLTSSQRNQLQNKSLLDASIWLTLQKILNTPNKTPNYSPFTNYRGEIEFSGHTFNIGINEISGLININHARPELIERLLQYAEVPKEEREKIAQNIHDWIDQDSYNSNGGLEKSIYQQLDLPYTPKNAPFASVEELRLIAGITSPIYQKISPFLTIHGNQEQVNIQSAPSVLRKMLIGTFEEQELTSLPYFTTYPTNLYIIQSELTLNRLTTQSSAIIEVNKNRRSESYRVIAWDPSNKIKMDL